MALGLACTLIFQTPVLAAEENGRNADLFHFDQQHLRLATGSGYHLHSCNDHGRQYTDYRFMPKNMDQVLYPGATVKGYDHASDSGKCTAERSGYYDRDRCFRCHGRWCKYFRSAG